MQRPPANPEFLGGLCPVTVAFLERTDDQTTLVFLKIDVILGTGFAQDRRFGLSPNGKRQVSGSDLLSG